MAPIRIYVVTFNCGRAFIDHSAFAAHFYKPYAQDASLEMPDFVVLSLQEMAPIAYCFLGGSYLKPYFSKIVDAVHYAAPGTEYKHVITHNAGMTGIVILAKPSAVDRIQSIEKAEVGVGIMEMGNKGAAAIRLSYDLDSPEKFFNLTFVAAHLAAGEGKVERRNKDWENIVRGLAFEPVSSSRTRSLTVDDAGEGRPLLQTPTNETVGTKGMFDSHSVLVFAGDLNYRSNDSKPDKDDHLSFPQPVEDTSDPKHYSHLLSHDQFTREFRAGKTMHHLAEAPVHFPPTYKYLPGNNSIVPSTPRGSNEEPSTWHWAPHRFPSWCDRVLFSAWLSESSESLKVFAYTVLPIQPTSDHRPIVFAAEINPENAMSSAKRNQNIYRAPFPLNPHWKEQRSAAKTKEVLVGLSMYLGWTWEGNGLLLATIVGAIGGWLVLRTLLNA